MGYIDENLLPGETVVYRAALHWVIFVWPAVVLLLFLMLGLSALTRDMPGVGVVLLLIGVLPLPSAVMTYKTSEFAVTNRRVVVKVGVFRRRSLETLLQKIERILVDQGIFGRIFGYGTIIISGTGGSKEPFPRISAPLDFRKRVQEQIGPVT